MDWLALIALHDEEIQWFWLRDAQHCENRMSLAAMVCFVIEQMGENFAAPLPLRGPV
jgi:hypothetical protein